MRSDDLHDYPSATSRWRSISGTGISCSLTCCPPSTSRPTTTPSCRRSSERNKETRALKDRDTYGRAFLQTTNLWEYNEVVKEYVMAKRFAGIAARLMGVQRVRLYHDQALFKEAGGGITPWHQDQHYWPLATDKTITMWMTLADISADMGTLRFASGSHVEGYLGDIPISDESEAQLRQFVERKGFTAGASRCHERRRRHLPQRLDAALGPAQPLRAHAPGHDGHLLRRWRARQRAG